MARRPGHIAPRKATPRAVVREVMGRSNGRCEWLGGCADTGAELDHIIPVAIGGKNTVENIALLCPAHHADKTKLDVRLIAKADRQGQRSGQQKRRKAKPVTRKMQGRGFCTKFKKTFSGEVVPR